MSFREQQINSNTGTNSQNQNINIANYDELQKLRYNVDSSSKDTENKNTEEVVATNQLIDSKQFAIFDSEKTNLMFQNILENADRKS